MQETLGTMVGLIPAAALGGLTAAYCALVANAYVAVLMAGGEPDSPSLRRALWCALQRIREQAVIMWAGLLRDGQPGAGLLRDGSGPADPSEGRSPDGQPPVATIHIIPGCTGLMAICFAILAREHGYSLFFFALAAAIAALLVLALIDARTRLLPDALTLPLMWAGLAFAWGGYGISLHDAVAGAMAGYGFLWFLFWLFKCLNGREGMGYGDFKLLAALGAWLGWRALAVVLLASCVAAVLFAVLRQRSLTPRGSYPFGPFLAASGTAGLLLGSKLSGLAW